MTITSRSSRRASANGSMLAVPPSTVARRFAPRFARARVDLRAGAGENARKQLRQFGPLRKGERRRRRALVEPIPPGPAADRTLDAEKQARRNLWRQRKGGRHEFSHRFETVRRLYSA